MGSERKFTILGMGLALALWAGAPAAAQTSPSAYEPPQSLWVGVEYANLQAGFPKDSSIRMPGIGVFAVYNWNHRLALEGHVRFLSFDSWHGETEQDYLAGPRYTFLHSDKWRPFARFQVGIVHIRYPFDMGTGNSFALSPAGGMEYKLNRKWSANAAYEFQLLTNSPDFTNEPKFGIHPNGATVGISYRLF